MTKKARVFVPLTKVDETQRLVYGRITQEILDKSGEVMDYASSKPHFEKWSADIHEASGGLSKGNLRVMHGLQVAGKVTEMDFNDDEQAIDICAKVVDDAEWEKVTTGCYTGFSVGGNYVKRWTETSNDNSKIKKYTAGPNEVSLVDNACVPSATFSMIKADGAEELVNFKVENDDAEWPDFAKADGAAGEESIPPSTEEPTQLELPVITNDQVVAKATDMAKSCGDPGKTWMDFVPQARDELQKMAPKKTAKDDKKAAKKETDDQEKEDKADSEEEEVSKATPAGVVQKWMTSDGQSFEKKADAVSHEKTLSKAEPTEAEKLRDRLNKATSAPVEAAESGLMEDFGRLSKVIEVLQTPWVDGAPKLEKGMYTVSSFARTLWDLGSLTRCIKKEGASEDDASDDAVAAGMKKAIADLSVSFKEYVDNQLTELMAGIDDDVCVEVYDYYYRATQSEGENQLAKDVCSVLTERKDPSRERREELTKSFGFVEGVVESTDEMSPPLLKRFEALEAEKEELKKVASEAVEKVEELAKRVQQIEDTPLPRAPGILALRDGDNNFMGKRADTEGERLAIIQDMLKTHGADNLALMMIKAAHEQGGHQLQLKS